MVLLSPWRSLMAADHARDSLISPFSNVDSFVSHIQPAA